MRILPTLICVQLALLLACTTNNKPAQTDSMTTNTTTNDTTSTHGYAQVGPLKLYYEIHGTGGTPLVLLHGGGSTIYTSFGKVLPLFAQHRQVIGVELQAHGHTADVDRPLSFEQDADDVAALLEHLHIEKADVLGFSNGGNTAMQLCVRHPDRVNKLVAISAFYKREGMFAGFFDMMQHASLESMPAPLKTAYLDITHDQAGLQKMHDRDVARMLNFKDWPDQTLQAIKAPALVVSGDHDVATNAHTVAMAKLIPNASLLILPGNHGSFIGEICTPDADPDMPAITVKLIESFLDGKLPKYP